MFNFNCLAVDGGFVVLVMCRQTLLSACSKPYKNQCDKVAVNNIDVVFKVKLSKSICADLQPPFIKSHAYKPSKTGLTLSTKQVLGQLS